MVAQDRVAIHRLQCHYELHQAFVDHEAPSYPYVAHLPHDPGEQVLPILWKKIDEDGPPGLIVAR